MATQGPIHDQQGRAVDPMIDPRTGEYAVIAPGHNFKFGDAEDRGHRADRLHAAWRGSAA